MSNGEEKEKKEKKARRKEDMEGRAVIKVKGEIKIQELGEERAIGTETVETGVVGMRGGGGERRG